MVIYSDKLKFGQNGTDNDERINFDRMRKERLAKTKRSLAKNNIAACLLTRPENVRYATSTTSVDFIDQLRYCMAFAEHDPILYEMPPGKTLGKCPWIKDENLKLAIQWANESCGKEATWEMAKKFAKEVKTQLQSKGIEDCKIAIDKLDEPAHYALKAEGIETVSAMPAMLEARAIKTSDEINCLKMATSIADVGWYAIYEALKPGVKEKDLVGIANEAMYRAGAESVWGVLVSSGANKPCTDKIIQVGDVVTTDFVRVAYMGYNTCYYRNMVVGRKPTQKEKDMHQKSLDRMNGVIECIKPGISTAEIAEKWQTAEDAGWPSEEHVWCEDLAHGIGLWLYEYPIINRLWSLEHPTIIEEGMTIAVEAMVFDEKVGRTKLEEMVVVTDRGAEIITRMPVENMIVANPIMTA